jgi:hypothetical protein
MERRVSQIIADSSNQNIVSAASRFITSDFSAIVGGNTTALVQVNLLCLRLSNSASRYEVILNRDSKDISKIAEQFISLDQKLDNQLKKNQV